MSEQLEKMQPEIQEKLTSILTWVEETAKTAGDFVVEQTPLYIQELLAWNFWYSLIWAVLGIICLSIGLFSVRQLYKNRAEIINSNDDFPSSALWGFPSFLGIIIGITIFLHNLDWLQITVAPRVWLVEYVGSKL